MRGKAPICGLLVVHSVGKARMDAEKRQTLHDRLLRRLAEIQAQLNQRKYKRRVYITGAASPGSAGQRHSFIYGRHRPPRRGRRPWCSAMRSTLLSWRRPNSGMVVTPF